VNTVEARKSMEAELLEVGKLRMEHWPTTHQNQLVFRSDMENMILEIKIRRQEKVRVCTKTLYDHVKVERGKS
jgi:predicted neutral ceramidase superfamily lipid hydrolase